MKTRSLLRATLTIASAVAVAASLVAGTAGAATKKTTKKSTIRVGVEGEFSGFSASSNDGSAKMAEAWEKWVNATGGINGHPVKVSVVDDAGDPAKGLATIKGFREKDKALAMVSGGSTNVMPQVAPYAKANNFPVIGADNYTPDWVGNPMMIPLGTTLPAILTAGMGTAKGNGLKKYGSFACAESPACNTEDLQKAIAPQVGIEFGGLELVAFDAPNYTAQCLKMKDKGVDVVSMATSAQGAIRMMADCQKQGYDPAFLINMTTWDTSLSDLKTARIVGAVNAVPFFADDPRAKNLKDVWVKYGPGGPIPTQQAALTFASLEFFKTVAAKINKTTPTSADFLKALATIKDETVGGLLANKINYKAGQKFAPPNLCYFTVSNDKGKLSSGTTAQCDAPVKLG